LSIVRYEWVDFGLAVWRCDYSSRDIFNACLHVS